MANARHLKALLESHVAGDDQRFFSVAMQAAAHEARMGHEQLADDLRKMIDSAKTKGSTLRREVAAVPISRPRGDLASLLAVSYPKSRMADMVLNDTLAGQLRRVIREQRHAARIWNMV